MLNNKVLLLTEKLPNGFKARAFKELVVEYRTQEEPQVKIQFLEANSQSQWKNVFDDYIEHLKEIGKLTMIMEVLARDISYDMTEGWDDMRYENTVEYLNHPKEFIQSLELGEQEMLTKYENKFDLSDYSQVNDLSIDTAFGTVEEEFNRLTGELKKAEEAESGKVPRKVPGYKNGKKREDLYEVVLFKSSSGVRYMLMELNEYDCHVAIERYNEGYRGQLFTEEKIKYIDSSLWECAIHKEYR